MSSEEASESLLQQSLLIPIQTGVEIAPAPLPRDVVWLSGSAIAVAPWYNPPPLIDYQPQEESENSVTDPIGASSGYNETTDDSDADSEATVEYDTSQVDDSDDSDEESTQEQVSNIDANSVIIIQHENEGEQLAQEPNVVTVPENPTAGVENPIIRLENPDYEPETNKSTGSEGGSQGGKGAGGNSGKTSKRSFGAMISDEEEDGQTCPVCLDVWTNGGEHRLCSLKCGHLFGKSCINRWLSKEKKKYCPQCNKKASPHDIRELYATKLVALDCTEKIRLQKEIQSVKDQKRLVELELLRSNLNVEMYKETINSLRSKLMLLSNESEANRKLLAKTEIKPKNRSIKFHLEKTVDVTEGNGRVCAYDPLTNTLILSHQSKNSLFPGYGIKKIQKIGTEYTCNHFYTLHTKAIRDVSFHPVTSNVILTVGFDAFAKVFDIKDHQVQANFKADYPLWCCCWDGEDPNVFYVGAGNGGVHVYDVRKLGSAVMTITSDEDSTAVVALRYVPSKPPFMGGVICCRLNSVIMYEKAGVTKFNSVKLQSLVGPFFALNYDPSTRHILVSCRPSVVHTRVRHLYCELNGTEIRNVHTFNGGTRQTLLSRSCFIKVCDETVIATFQENSNSIDLFSTSSGSKLQSIIVNDQILDLTPIHLGSRTLFGAVSDTLLRFYETFYLKPN